MYLTMPDARPDLDDDLDLDLPGGRGASLDDPDSELEPHDDDDDLGLSGTGEQEQVGLDASTGLDGLDEQALLQFVDDESTRWSEGSEAAGALEGDDGGLEGEAARGEYGWTDGNDPSETGGFDDGLITLDESVHRGDDGGAEGLTDDALELEVDPRALPPLQQITHDGVDPLDEGTTQDLESFAAELLGGAAGDIDDEATREIAEGLFCTDLPSDRVSVETLHVARQPLVALATGTRHAVAFIGGELLVAEVGNTQVTRLQPGTRALWDLALADTPAEPFIALATPEGLLCSEDGGRSFGAAGSLPGGELPPDRIAITRDGDDLRLWAAAPEGALCASDDRGRTFAVVLGDARVLRLASDGRRSLLALTRDDDGTAVAEHCTDGGSLFERLELPAGEVERLQEMCTCRDSVLVCRRAPEPRLLLGSSEDPWLELLAHAEPPMALVDEDGLVVAYCCVGTDDGQLLLRRTLDGGVTPQVVMQVPDDAGAAMQLRGSHADGVTTLQLGTARSWLRVTLRLAGSVR